MRIASELATFAALLIGSTLPVRAQGPGATGIQPSGGPVSTILTLSVLAVIVIAIVVVARYATRRRRQNEEAVLLQSQLSDFIARDAHLHGLGITARAQASGWHRSQVTIAVAGEVPTPQLRDSVMRVVAAEAWRIRPDAITLNHLFIVPPARAASNELAQRG